MNTPERVRIAVVGCGMVAQAMHLPHLSQLQRHVELTALADPSRTVRDAIGARYGVRRLHDDYHSLLEEDLDALLIAAPAAAHAEITLAALDAGLHVFVEKPMCITLEDADRILEARAAAGRVVQVGYMKRYDPASERMAAELPESAESLRYIRVMCHDPEWVPFFGDEDIVRAT